MVSCQLPVRFDLLWFGSVDNVLTRFILGCRSLRCWLWLRPSSGMGCPRRFRRHTTTEMHQHMPSCMALAAGAMARRIPHRRRSIPPLTRPLLRISSRQYPRGSLRPPVRSVGSSWTAARSAGHCHLPRRACRSYPLDHLH
jgi:hypothetical protein